MKLKNLLLILLILAIGILAGSKLSTLSSSWFDSQRTEEATVLLESIQKVSKLISVEGNFSEIYQYQDHKGFDLSFFRKKALVRVKAKVSVGFDLQLLEIETLPDQKLLLIKNFPAPEILSIDHDLDYYDITEGTFNAFTEKELTSLNQNAKRFIESKVEQSNLTDLAIEQANELLETITFLSESMDWQVKTVQNDTIVDLSQFKFQD